MVRFATTQARPGRDARAQALEIARAFLRERVRLTADGQFRNCLFSTTEWDARQVLREGGSDDEIASLLRDCVLAKRAAHGIGTPAFERPARAMYQIGG
jgi:cyclic pyranopterin phosphate synthase